MELTSFAELNVTKEKLLMLETFYAEQERTPADNPFVKEQSQLSVKQMIDQLRQEIARFESKAFFTNPAESSKQPEPSVPSSKGA